MIGKKIHDLRVEKNITQEQLAKMIGTTPQNIYKYEKGIITNIPLDKVEDIAKILEVDPGYLTGWGKYSDKNEGLPEEAQKLIDILPKLDIPELEYLLKRAEMFEKDDAP